MPTTIYLTATCTKCGKETTVVEVVWAATRWDPADGEMRPDECECGQPFDDDTRYEQEEPPDPY